MCRKDHVGSKDQVEEGPWRMQAPARAPSTCGYITCGRVSPPCLRRVFLTRQQGDRLPTFLPSYLPTFLSSYLPTFLPSYPPAFLPSYTLLLTHLPTFLPSYLPTFSPSHLPIFLPSYLPTFLHVQVGLGPSEITVFCGEQLALLSNGRLPALPSACEAWKPQRTARQR